MSEEQITSTEPAKSQEGDGGKTFDAEYVKKLRDEAARYRTEAKANADAAKRLADLEDADKTEQQKLTDQLAQATTERDEAVASAARLRVAVSKGLPADLVDRLRGDTEDELAEDADKLLALVAKDERPRPPAPDPRQGGNGGGHLSTAQQFAAAIEGQL